MTAVLGGVGYIACIALNNDDNVIDTQCFDTFYEGETIDLHKAITTMINTIRNNNVDHIIIDGDITRWVVEYIILTVINALDSEFEIGGLNNLPDYDATKNLMKTPSNEEEAQENYAKFRAFLSKSIADKYQK